MYVIMKLRERQQYEVKWWEHEQSRTTRENSSMWIAVPLISVIRHRKRKKNTSGCFISFTEFSSSSLIFSGFIFFPHFTSLHFIFRISWHIRIFSSHIIISFLYSFSLLLSLDVCDDVYIRAFSLVLLIWCRIVVVRLCMSVVWRARFY
jgi:hypothetical protein